MSTRFPIRPYAPSDCEAVRNICWETANLGGDILHLYSDRESWVDMYTSYYTDEEPESGFVVLSKAGDRVLGYLLGCVDTRKARSEVQIGLRHNLTRFLWARPGTAGFWWRATWDMLTDWEGPKKPRVDLERYPGHMHCNLLPEARARGVAVSMFHVFHDYLRSRGVKGTHGEAYAHNLPVHAMLAKVGYQKFGDPYRVPGVRTREGARQYGQMVICDLS